MGDIGYQYSCVETYQPFFGRPFNVLNRRAKCLLLQYLNDSLVAPPLNPASANQTSDKGHFSAIFDVVTPIELFCVRVLLAALPDVEHLRVSVEDR